MSWGCANCGRILADGESHTACIPTLEKMVKDFGAVAFEHGYSMSLAGSRWYESDYKRQRDELIGAIRRLAPPQSE